MSSSKTQPCRREFLRQGAYAALAAAGGSAAAQAQSPMAGTSPHTSVTTDSGRRDEFEGFSRFRPSRGENPDGDFYLGKLVPGLRSADAGPAPFVAPDLDKLSWELKDGAKEFHLVAQQVEREFLPGYKMIVWGYNGSMPGPTIEVTQGDRVRLVVHNELPEETMVHWHGFELPIQFDGSHTLTQNPIKPGKSFVYEFDVHEAGTFFYHSHIAMQETMGMMGWFIVHPRTPWNPPVDRDFGLIFQNFFIRPNQTVNDSWNMEWNWHTINGRSGPYSTPMVVKHGERVRIRIVNFSPEQHHPVHMHGHTFWLTGREGSRTPKSAWIPRNNELIGVAQAAEFEFIANNPGDWMFHCHMTHHMMNHMVRHVGPRIRPGSTVDDYLANLDERPATPLTPQDPGFSIPGYPQMMKHEMMPEAAMKKIWGRREMMGMRSTAPMSLMGLMTVVRVLPEDLYRQVMETDDEIPKDAIFEEIVKRFGNPDRYEKPPMTERHHDHMKGHS